MNALADPNLFLDHQIIHESELQIDFLYPIGTQQYIFYQGNKRKKRFLKNWAFRAFDNYFQQKTVCLEENISYLGECYINDKVIQVGR